VRFFWVLHRAAHRITGGRLGLWRATPEKWGTMRLTTVGTRTGRERSAILGYHEDGPNLIAVAMNGWADAEPAWWLNLQDHPDASVELPDGTRHVRGRAAAGDERTRLWALWHGIDGYAPRRSRETAIVVLEPHVDPR